MAIYVDELKKWPNGTGLWCHMATDGPIEELHQFAGSIGLKRGWFQDHKRCPHYDLRPEMRLRAVTAGAVQVTSAEQFKRCNIVGKVT